MQSLKVPECPLETIRESREGTVADISRSSGHRGPKGLEREASGVCTH